MIDERLISNFLAYRYDPDFFSASSTCMLPKGHTASSVPISNTSDLRNHFEKFADYVNDRRVAVLLSGGIDSAIVASYVPKGSLALTIVYDEDESVNEDAQASKYADMCGLQLVKVHVSWEDVLQYHDDLLINKGLPLHPIEIALYKAFSTAKNMGADLICLGAGADCVFGGHFKLLSNVYDKYGYYRRISTVDPELVLRNGRRCDNQIDPFVQKDGTVDVYHANMKIIGESTALTFSNPAFFAGVQLYCPFEECYLCGDLDLDLIRHGREKYIVQDLFELRYSLKPPTKRPFTRPVNKWMNSYVPSHEEINVSACAKLSFEQKWYIFSLERYFICEEAGYFKRYKTGYTTGVYDLFHVGHLNLLRRAKRQCDSLIVGVTIDGLVSYKKKKCVIPFDERIKIVEACKYVDRAVGQLNMDKVSAAKNYMADVVFVGSDWKGTERWKNYEDELAKNGIDVVYLPHTPNVSTSLLKDKTGFDQ